MHALRRRVSLAALAMALVIGAAGRPAGAQGDDEEEAGGEVENRKRAGKHVEQGDRFKEAGEYDKAAREYEKAYDLVPHPELFFNLAQVYRLGGKKEKALEYYDKYLAVQPNGRAAAQSKRFARQLRKQLEKAKPRPGSQSGSGSGSPSESGSGSGSAAGSGSGSGSGGDVSAGVDRSRRGRIMRIAGMASAGAGLVALAVGVKYGLDARKISNDLSDHDEGMWTDELLAKQAKGKRAETRMFIGTGVGAALIAGGAVLYYLGHRADKKDGEGEGEGMAALPVVGDDTLGFAVSGRF